jgi:hypothetical protein
MSAQSAAALATTTLVTDGEHQVHPTTPHPGLSVHAAVPAPRRDSPPAGAGGMDLGQLRRFQWAVRAALALGVAASVCANILHARDNLIAQTIAAWPPLALMLTVELISRVPVYRRALAALRMLATGGIAGIAAYVSYFHMAAVVARFGEHPPNPYLLPISVDGLIVVASVSLVELAGRVRDVRDHEAANRAQPPAEDTPPPEERRVGSDEPLADRARRNGHTSAAPPVVPLPSPPVSEPAVPPVVPLSSPPLSEPAAPPVTPLPSPPVSESEPSPLDPPADDPADPEEAREADTDPDLAALMPAARAARDTLNRNGRSLTRDSLAAQLRRDGHTIRTSRVSALLNLIKNDEPAPVNGRRRASPS